MPECVRARWVRLAKSARPTPVEIVQRRGLRAGRPDDQVAQHGTYRSAPEWIHDATGNPEYALRAPTIAGSGNDPPRTGHPTLGPSVGPAGYTLPAASTSL